MDQSEQRHQAFVEAVEFYEKLFPNTILEREIRAELMAGEGARLSDAVRDPSENGLVCDIRRVLGPRRRLPPPSPDEREYVVRRDALRVRGVLVASWLEAISSACAQASDFVRLDRALLPPYLPDDGANGEGNWRTGIVSRPSVYLLRREPAGRVFDAFISQIRDVLDEKGELPLFAFPKTTIKKSSSSYFILFG